MVTLRNLIHSAVAMMICFGSLAGMYALLGAPIVAAAQVLIYLGAISVLILFAIMITQSKAGPGRLVFQRQWWAGALAAVLLVLLMLVAVLLTSCPLAGNEIVPQPARDIARLLFGDYLFAFEVVGVLLLAAVIGGLYLARRDPDMPETNRPLRPGADDEEGA